jgi:hypothetical protein
VKGKGALWLWVGVLVVFLAGSSYVGYRLWKRQKNRAMAAEMQRWEMKTELQLNSVLNEEDLTRYLESENLKLDRYEVLRPVVDELDLVATWGVADVDEAMERLKTSSEMRAGDGPGTILFVVSDKDKEMTGKLAQSIGRSYKALLLREKLRAPTPPPGYTE